MEEIGIPQQRQTRHVPTVGGAENTHATGVDIVAGTASTLIYQLLVYGKATWFLETDYKWMEDLVELGHARLVRYEDLETLDDSYFEPTDADPKYLFTDGHDNDGGGGGDGGNHGGDDDDDGRRIL